MDLNEAWDEAEKLIEENCTCKMRELRQTREKIMEVYAKKFSTREIFGHECFPQVLTNIKDSKESKIYLAEMCIQRDYLINEMHVSDIYDMQDLTKKERKDTYYNFKNNYNLTETEEDVDLVKNITDNFDPIEVINPEESAIQ